MNILLTGATGFIGSAFTRLALSRGHRVAGLILPTETPPAALADARGLTWLRGTLNAPPWPELAAFAPEVCAHAAWITTPGVYLESPENERFLAASVAFMRRVRELGTTHLVGLGTCIEYQITDQPLSETRTPVAPTTRYARCKNELRLALEADAKAHGVTAGWARVFYPYGPGEHPSRLCSALLQKLARGEALPLKTPDSTKDYIFITDLAAALLTVVEKRAEGPINLGTGVGVSVRQIAETLAEMLGQPGLVSISDPPQVDPLPFVVADATRLRSLGWRPQIELREGLERLRRAILEDRQSPVG